MHLMSVLKKTVLLFSLLLIVACKPGDMPRGQFHGFVMDKTEEEIVKKMGKPNEDDRKNPNKIVLTYHQRTFDTDNYNKQDPKTVITLEKNKDGKIVCTNIEFGV